jgi:hypothetical protein
MALCVFRRKSPSFSPLSFDVLIPCYDACWEANTKEECLEYLKSLPKQTLVSTALRQLAADDADSVAALESSSFGMFVLILSRFLKLFFLGLNTYAQHLRYSLSAISVDFQ